MSIRNLILFSALVAGLSSSLSAAANEPDAPGLSQTPLFVSGEGGYHTYRIPAIVVTHDNVVLAFCEGRMDSGRDEGNIDILLRRSTDGGATWEPMQLVADFGPDTIGNPCPVVDRETGIVWLLLTSNLAHEGFRTMLKGTSSEYRKVWVTHSRDSGKTWAELKEITESAMSPDWNWYATGPGRGIQLRSGRLLIPCDHAVIGTSFLRSHVIYSDDHGESWHIGGIVDNHTNECQVVEFRDGSVQLNTRSYHGRAARGITTSHDGGRTFTPLTLDDSLPEPVCQAAIIRYAEEESDAAQPLSAVSSPSTRTQPTQSRVTGLHEATDVLVFGNPAAPTRELMTVRLSPDGGRTWPYARVLYAGPTAYSALAVLPDRSIACLYERGESHPYERITLARFNLSWLTHDTKEMD